MDTFVYKDSQLHVEDTSCDTLASEYGTPLFVYSRKAIEHGWQSFANALQSYDHGSLICFAVKSNSNLGVLSVLARLGSGFDIVSGGELKRVIAAGGDPKKTVFSGVGKKCDEMEFALEQGIRCFNVESLAELQRLADVAAAHGTIAPVSLRINPDVDAGTHPYISTGLKENKFGIAVEDAKAAYQFAANAPSLNVSGIDCHIGSQLTEIDPYLDALDRLLLLVDDLRSDGIDIHHLDIGGGQGICYKDEVPLDIAEWVSQVTRKLHNHKLELLVEPGRVIVGNAGILLTRVEYVKKGEDKNFLIVDAAMNDLIRPPLYSAWQDIVEVKESDKSSQQKESYDVVGPVCESSDFLGKDRMLSADADDLLAIKSCGAYCFVMSSNYNTRARSAEVIVDGENSHVVRKREVVESLFELEATLPSS